MFQLLPWTYKYCVCCGKKKCKRPPELTKKRCQHGTVFCGFIRAFGNNYFRRNQKYPNIFKFMSTLDNMVRYRYFLKKIGLSKKL